jgi:hypothetical protein
VDGCSRRSTIRTSLAGMGRRPLPLSPSLLAMSASMRELAVVCGGVVTAAQCRVLGVDDAAVRRLIGAGCWTRARRVVYADAVFSTEIADSDHHGCCAALLASLARPAVVSHLSAARLLGLPLPPGRSDPRAVITRRAPAPSNDPVLGGVHVRDDDEVDVIEVGGVAVLAGARVVLDCGDVLAPESALAVGDAALARRITSMGALRTARRAGRVRTRAIDLVVERADPRAESWFESVSRWWLREAGLPRPRLRVPFTDAQGRVRARVDMLFGRVVGEADGAGEYDEPGVLVAEKRREDWLRDVHRVEVVRWVPEEMRSPSGRAAVVARFTRAAARAG